MITFKSTFDAFGLDTEEAAYFSGIPFSDMFAHMEGDTELTVGQMDDLAACLGLELRQLFVLSGDLEPTKDLIRGLRERRDRGQLRKGEGVSLGTQVRALSRVKRLEKVLGLEPHVSHSLKYLTMEAFAQEKIGHVEVCSLLGLKHTDPLPSHPKVLIHPNLLKPLMTRKKVSFNRIYRYCAENFPFPHLTDCQMTPHREGFKAVVSNEDMEPVTLFVDKDYHVSKEP